MHWTATLRDQSFPRGSRVKVDLECKACGYNLRYASVDSKCPECGEPVNESLLRLSLPDGIVDGFRDISFGSITMLIALLFFIPPFSNSLFGILGVLALAISSFFRLLGSYRMRYRLTGKKRILSSLINLLFVLSVIEVLLVASVCVPIIYLEGFSQSRNEILIISFGVWILVSTFILIITAHISRVIALLTGYSFIKWESRATILALVIGGVGVCMSNSFNLIFQQTWWLLNTVKIVFGCIFVLGLLLSFVSSRHAANVAEKARNHIEELIEKTPESSNL